MPKKTEVTNQQTTEKVTEIETVEPKIATVERTIIVRRFCADGTPLGLNIQKEISLPDIVLQNTVLSESSNEQTTDSHTGDKTHARTRKDTIQRKRTLRDCTGFRRDDQGTILQDPIRAMLSEKLFGAFKECIPTYLNSASAGRIAASLSLQVQILSTGEIEPEPESQMVETNGMTKGTIWRYAEVLSDLKAKVVFTTRLLQQRKLEEFTEKCLGQRVGKFHNKSITIGTIEVVKS